MPEFKNPAAFLFVLAIPLLYILRHYKFFTRITFPAVLADWEGKTFEWKGKSSKFFSLLARTLIQMAFVFTVAVLAEPVITTQEKIYTSAKTDIIFVVDSSPSMAGRDMDGLTRMEAVKNTIKQTAREHAGIRYGIVVLGNEASVFLPPTLDFSAFLRKVDDLKVGILGNGSAIGDGLTTAICHLVPSSAPGKCIILLTDGENNAGEIHPETAAELAYANNIKIYVVGTGTKGIIPIEYTDPFTGKLYSGSLESNFNAAPLKKIAEKTEAQYFEVSTIPQLTGILDTIANTENLTPDFIYKTRPKALYPYFLICAIALFAAGWIIKRLFLKEAF